MNQTSTIFCLERRIGTERRLYSYDSHIPDRMAEKRHCSAMDRWRENHREEWIDLSQMAGNMIRKRKNERPSHT